jgi:hypothetical protein
MNATRNRVAATFAPETRFEVWPTPGTPFRANLETEFERLKNRLLARELETIEQPGLNAPLRRAANEAAALAWVTFYPLLVFPELFEEKARLAVQQAVRQARILAETGELAVAA